MASTESTSSLSAALIAIICIGSIFACGGIALVISVIHRHYAMKKAKRDSGVTQYEFFAKYGSCKNKGRTWPQSTIIYQNPGDDIEHVRVSERRNTALTGWNLPRTPVIGPVASPMDIPALQLTPSAFSDLAFPELAVLPEDSFEAALDKHGLDTSDCTSNSSEDTDSWKDYKLQGHTVSQIKRTKRAETLAILEGKIPTPVVSVPKNLIRKRLPEITRKPVARSKSKTETELQASIKDSEVSRDKDNKVNRSSFLEAVLGAGKDEFEFKFEVL